MFLTIFQLFFHSGDKVVFCFDVDFEITQTVRSVWAVGAVEGLLPCVSHQVVMQVLPLVAPAK